jgi:hypothetical protein
LDFETLCRYLAGSEPLLADGRSFHHGRPQLGPLLLDMSELRARVDDQGPGRSRDDAGVKERLPLPGVRARP